MTTTTTTTCTSLSPATDDRPDGQLDVFNLINCDCFMCTHIAEWDVFVRYGTQYAADMSQTLVKLTDIDLVHLPYMDGAGAHLFHPDRKPWEETDPYPDFVLDASQGDGTVLLYRA